MMVYLLLSGVLLTRLRRPTGRLTVEEQRLEGEFRYINSRLITNAEEVAFYQGNRREKLTIIASYNKLVSVSFIHFGYWVCWCVFFFWGGGALVGLTFFDHW
jgi:ABC-type uncharacterized transport system fused permease/ATPase subunit